MTATLTEQAALAASPGFQARVRAGMIAAAGSIANIPQAGPPPLGPLAFAARTGLATAVVQGADAYLGRFAWAVATSPAVSNDMHQPVAITGTGGGMPATITTAVPHGLTSGQTVEIDGTADDTVNGTWAVAVADATHFTIPVYASKFEAVGGSATQQPADLSIQTAINTVWGVVAGVTAATV